jgi:hypothetical protein
MRTFVPPVGALPDSPTEWSHLRKGGSNGVFLLVLALSWMPLYLARQEEQAKVELLIKDLTWVLSVLSNRVYFEKDRAVRGDTNKKDSGGNGKRKLVGGGAEVLRNSKKRKGL